MPPPRPSTRSSRSRARRSSAFVRERHAPIDSCTSTCPALTNRGNPTTSWRGRPTHAHRDRDRPRGGTGGRRLRAGPTRQTRGCREGQVAAGAGRLREDRRQGGAGLRARGLVRARGFTPPHRHPGAVFGHVLEGEFEAQLEGQPLRKLKAGDTFYEPTMALHSVSRNPSKTANTRLLAVILHPRDAQELVVLETPKH